ncbi:single-stranded DNA-binding protein [Nocardioides sp.]|uniref:single-stranded DNA-binding protein n=1 Tax=Nocardioides sp. TaxID=35761 RepID=UPI00286CD341|nr:single-stranded DNA-binding protein [Nocardioides sp.]
MATQTTTAGDLELVNEVRLVGRISQEPESRELPSGDTIWTFRVVVPRAPAAVRPHQSVDALECVVWSGRLKRSVRGWHAGDVVEVSGQLRRRFYRGGGAPVSRVEVEVCAGRVIRRATSG